MKIGFICADPSIPVLGHAECSMNIQELIRAWLLKRHQITLIARHDGGSIPQDLSSIRLIKLPQLQTPFELDHERQLLAGNADIARAVSDYPEFDLVYERYSLWSHAGLSKAREQGAFTILEVNAALVEEQKNYRDLHDEEGAVIASLRAFAAAQVIIATSDHVAEYLQQFHQARNKVHVIPNGVNDDRYAHYQPREFNQIRPLTIGFLGELNEHCGVDLLLKAYTRVLSQIRYSQVKIIGSGSHVDHFRQLTQQLGIQDRVQFCGQVLPVQTPFQLGEMDIALAPQKTLDQCQSATSIYEYMASGLAVIASDSALSRQIIQHQHNGLLFSGSDEHALAEAIMWLYRNPQQAQAIAARAQRQVLNEHSWSVVSDQILDLAGLGSTYKQRISV